MALQLTEDELQEVSLALSAYREVLARCDSGGATENSLHAVDSVRRKIAVEWSSLLAGDRELRKSMTCQAGAFRKEAS